MVPFTFLVHTFTIPYVHHEHTADSSYVFTLNAQYTHSMGSSLPHRFIHITCSPHNCSGSLSYVCGYIHNTIFSSWTRCWLIPCVHFERTLYPRHMSILTMPFTHIMCSPHTHNLSLSFYNWNNIFVHTMCSTWTHNSSTYSMNSTSAFTFWC